MPTNPPETIRVWKNLDWSCSASYGLLGLFYAYLFFMLWNNVNYQWDFNLYYSAGRAVSLGLNPYDPDVISSLTGIPSEYRFCYPPTALLLFKLLSRFDFTLAYHVFIIAKALSLSGLILVWHKLLGEHPFRVYFPLFIAFGYGWCIWADLRSGNITIFEQLALWTGILSMERGWGKSACALIILSSIFKLTNVVFLLMVLFTNYKQHIKYVVISMAVFLLIVFFPMDSHERTFDFITTVAWAAAKGGSNFSLFCVLGLLSEKSALVFNTQVPVLYLQVTAFIIFSILLVSFTALAVIKSLKSSREATIRCIYVPLVLVYGLILPRMADYTYMILLLPTFLALSSSDTVKHPLWLLVLSLGVPADYILPEMFKSLKHLLFTQSGVFINLFAWFMWFQEVRVKRYPPDNGILKL